MGKQFACLPRGATVKPNCGVHSDAKAFECFVIRKLASITVESMEDTERIGGPNLEQIVALRQTAQYVHEAVSNLSDEELYDTKVLVVPTSPRLKDDHPAFIHKRQAIEGS